MSDPFSVLKCTQTVLCKSKLLLSSFLVISTCWMAFNSRDFPRWWRKFCFPSVLVWKDYFELMKQSFNNRISQLFFLSDKASNSSVVGVGHWTKQIFGTTRPPILNSYIFCLQDVCPKWLRVEFADFSEITKDRTYDCFCASF